MCIGPNIICSFHLHYTPPGLHIEQLVTLFLPFPAIISLLVSSIAQFEWGKFDQKRVTIKELSTNSINNHIGKSY